MSRFQNPNFALFTNSFGGIKLQVSNIDVYYDIVIWVLLKDVCQPHAFFQCSNIGILLHMYQARG